ncbi:toxin Fic, partial [Belliella baltica]|uniref:toxin Fic n=1 Tax=Belliella baltica TaxID=232259 RepID=UPI0003082C38
MKARDLLLYHTQDQQVNVSVYFQDGSFWLTQKGMAELFGVNVPTINKHLKNIFES